MKKQMRRMLCRRIMATVLLSGLVVSVATSCNDDDVSSVGTLISSEISGGPTPEPVPVATLAPQVQPTISPREEPDFATVTPPPISVDLPDQPQVTEFNAVQDLLLQYEVTFTGIQVRGVIQSVDIQLINTTCGTDVTGVLNPSAVAQFQSLLIGRGNSVQDIGGTGEDAGFDFEYIFPTDITFFEDGRILARAERDILTGAIGDDGQPEVDEGVLSGDDVVFFITITDSFGQVVLVSDSVFEEGDDVTFLGCGGILVPSGVL